MNRFLVHAILAYLLTASPFLIAKTFTILHTNDWQSRLLGFGPNSNYEPSRIGDGTVGGIARLATLLKAKREAAGQKGAVLVLDAGDFTMGTLFHTITRETGGELQLLNLLGYDAVALGNHEFDFGPQGLGDMIESALREAGSLPRLLASNMVLSENDPSDAKLRKFVKQGIITDHAIIERGEIRFGLFGIMGYDASEVTVSMGAVTFSDPIETSRKMVALLKEKKADVIIVLSHSGVTRKEDGSWGGEDVELVKKVPGIDIVIGGHSHTTLDKPILEGKTSIVQVGSEVQFLGELEMRINSSVVSMQNYVLNAINDQILGDNFITQKIEHLADLVSELILKPMGIRFDEPIAKIESGATRDFEDDVIGNLVASSYKRATGADIGFTPNGVLRDDLHYGRDGIQNYSDIFRILPLGVGEIEDTPGYPLVKVWVNGKELKSILEVLLLAYKVKNESYYPRFAGIEFDYNPLRVPFDRVMEVRLQQGDGSYLVVDLNDENSLYSIAATSYEGKFFWVIPEVSMGLLSVTPKFEDGTPVHDIGDALFDAQPDIKAIQEYKAWRALLDHIRKLVPDEKTHLAFIPTSGAAAHTPMIKRTSLDPQDLYKNATWIQWTATAVFLVSLSVLIFGFILLIRWKRSR
ncbi:MAG: bifunctional metallophosphatase/5'-nucleotidase [Deltaproteobacteria bacterium]|nr:bifunctional metallophosphatase/5'-nucleotidase [Deltaproteobacteria bacterium]